MVQDPYTLTWCSRTLHAVRATEQEADELWNGESASRGGKAGNPHNAWGGAFKFCLMQTLSHSTNRLHIPSTPSTSKDGKGEAT